MPHPTALIADVKGLCVLILTFMPLNQYTAIGLISTAASIA